MMKTIQYFFFVTMATILMAADCSNKDSEFYNDVYVNSPNLANVEVLGNATQTVYVNANFSRYLNVTGQTNPVDLFKTSAATKFNFSYELEKSTIDTWDYVDISNSQLLVEKGAAVAGSFVFGQPILNTTNQTYEYRVGIQSLPPGNYRLSFGYNSTSTTDVEFRSESPGNNLVINLRSPYSGLTGGYYYFTIN